MKNLFITKPVEPAGHVDAGEPFEGSLTGEPTLRRTLTGRQLMLLGVGAVIGAGIFVLTGQAAANYAGPAVMLSFVFAGIACAFAGLCYAEFAAMLPVSGSAYSYSYATLGESVAWFIGWCLILEYLFAASTVAVGWSGYLNAFLSNFDLALPEALASAPLVYEGGRFVRVEDGLVNLPAMLIVAGVCAVGYIGISQSAFVNSIIVAVKVTVILLFIAFGIQYVDPANWEPFIPANEGGDRYGMEGVLRASTVVFFAYIGFDAVSTSAGEARNPQKDMPVGILGSLAICTVLYIAMCLVLTGMMPYQQLGTAEPVSTALINYPSLGWLQTLVELAAIAGLTSVILVMLMAQPRIFYSMAQDGLLPRVFGRVHPKYRTPHVGTVIVGVVAAVLAGLLPIGILGDIVSMGTLLAFATVCVGVLVLRRTRPDLERPFRVPAVKVIAPLGAVACLYLFWLAFVDYWYLLIGWMVVGALVYGLYGYRNSKLRRAANAR